MFRSLGQWRYGEQWLVPPGAFPVSHDLIAAEAGPFLYESERAGFQAAREHDSVRRHRGAAACMVGMEVCYGVIPLVPVHVDHHTVEGADPRHETTIAKVSAWSLVMPNTCPIGLMIVGTRICPGQPL